MSKKTLPLIVVSIFLTGCAPYFSENRFERNGVRNTFSFGFAGYNNYDFCKQRVPNFNAPYKNGVNPRRTCTSYQYYTCHISHYCNGDKQCEMDAANYWLKPWHDIKTGKLLDRVTATKEICEAEEKRNSIGKSENKK